MSDATTTTAPPPPGTTVEPQIGANGAVAPLNGHRNGERQNGEPRPVKRGTDRPRLETWLVALFFGIVYGVVGYFMLVDARIVDFDSLQVLNNAYTAWWNSPPKLAAIPLDVAPFDSLIYMPLALIKPLATSLIALPVATAIAAGLLMALLNSTMARCEFPIWMRFLFLILFGLNPMFVYYACNGDPTVLGMMFAGISLLSLISWGVSQETRFLALGGLAMAVAVMFDYGYFLWTLGIALAIMFVGSENSQEEDRRRSALFVFLTPPVYALSIWILIQTALLGSPFGWISARSGMIQVNTSGALDAIGASFGGTMGDLGEVVLGIAPLALLAVILLVAAGIVKRSGLAWGLLLVLVLAAAVPVIRALVADQASLVNLSVGLPIAMVGLFSAAWVYRSEESWRVGVAIVIGIGLIAALPLGWNAMREYQFQNQAQAFTRWIEDRDTQEGTNSLGDYSVGIDPEVAMASYINEALPQTESSILVDENFSYGPMILSGRPTLFADRADEGEAEWEATLDNPFGVVDYMLITISRGGDQLRKRYPDAISGGELGMTPVFRTERYMLLEISQSKPPAKAVAGPGEVVPSPTPTPFTPQKPPDPSAPEATTTVPGTAPEPTVTPSPTPTPATGPGPGGASAPQIEGE
jgi:cell division septation protein DedD